MQKNVLLPSTSRSAASSLAVLMGAGAVCRPVGGPTYYLRLMKRVCLRRVKRWPVRGQSTRVKQRWESWESLAVPTCPVSWLWGSELCVCKGCVLATRAAQFKWNGKKKWKLYAPSSMTDGLVYTDHIKIPRTRQKWQSKGWWSGCMSCLQWLTECADW